MGERGEWAPVKAGVKALWAPRSPVLITDSNHWSTDANRVVFKLFGKKVTEFTTEMQEKHFFHCLRMGCCLNTPSYVPSAQHAAAAAATVLVTSWVLWRELPLPTGECGAVVLRIAAQRKSFLTCYRGWIGGWGENAVIIQNISKNDPAVSMVRDTMNSQCNCLCFYKKTCRRRWKKSLSHVAWMTSPISLQRIASPIWE